MNIQEYIDQEVAKGNMDIRVPRGLDPVDELYIRTNATITFTDHFNPWNKTYESWKQTIKQFGNIRNNFSTS